MGLERGLVRERGRAEVAGEAGEGGGGLEVVLAGMVVVEGGKGILLQLLMGIGGRLHGRKGLLLLLLWLLLLDKLPLLLCLLLGGGGRVCLRRPRVLPLGVLVEVAAGGEVLGAHGAREGAAVGAVAAGHLGRGEREEGNGEIGAKQIDWYYSTGAPLFEGPPSEKRKPSDSLVGNCKVAGEKRYELEGGGRKKRTPSLSTQLSSSTLAATFFPLSSLLWNGGGGESYFGGLRPGSPNREKEDYVLTAGGGGGIIYVYTSASTSVEWRRRRVNGG